MYEDMIFHHLWIVLPLWLVLHVGDYYLTIIGARLYKLGASEHFVHRGSYELTPEHQDDIEKMNMAPLVLVRHSIFISVATLFLWGISQILEPVTIYYKFLVGGIMVHKLAVYMIHARNLVLFGYAAHHHGISGKIEYERWLDYRLSAAHMFQCGVLFLLVFFLTGSVLFAGGALICFLTGLEHCKISDKHKDSKQSGERKNHE